ncbi:MAG: NnrS family protein, partial [Deltaproteobacteria bacterium]|nr:NnrS family protein [Deltaproteobacteria bacterium]
MPIIFSYAFRPLFLLTTLYAIAIVPFWVAGWMGLHSVPTTLGPPMWWHAHEMIFGFAGAAVGGFSLTAVATWTKRPPVAGVPLALLVALWMVARVLFFLPFEGMFAVAALADMGYASLLFGLMSREILGARSRRNYKVLAILASFALVHAMFLFGVATHAPWVGATGLAAVWVLVLLINLIGGR